MGDVPLPADLSTLLAEMERRIRTLETAPKLANSSVTDGSMTVVDAVGTVKTRFGKLSDGSYGIEVLNPNGQLVNLANAVFPKTAVYVPTQNMSNLSWALLPNGPSVSVTVGASGIVLVTATADIGLNVNGQTGNFGFYNATTGYVSSGWLSVQSPSLTYIAGTSGKSVLVTGLPPNTTQTFQAAAYVSTSNVNYSNATIIAQPY